MDRRDTDTPGDDTQGGNTDTESDERVSSLELGPAADLLDAEDRFPLTTEDVASAYGDVEVGFPKGSERLGDILETTGEETYDSPDELELAILNGVGSDAVGRQHYSDRGTEQSESPDRSEDSL